MVNEFAVTSYTCANRWESVNKGSVGYFTRIFDS